MSEYLEIQRIISDDSKKIVFWGASETAVLHIQSLVNTFITDDREWTIVDTYLHGKKVLISNQSIPVEEPSKYFGKLVIWILCVSTKNAYAEVYSMLLNNNYEYGIDFIDGMQFQDFNSEFPHGDLIERDIYSPWITDNDFREKLDGIQDNTLVDGYRCYELYKMVKQTQKCGKGDILEVGVWRGGTGALMASTLQDIDVNFKVYLADTFEGVVKTGQEDIYYKDGSHNDTTEEVVESLLNKMDINNAEICKGIFPDDFGDRFNDKQWRLVHIDVDVYQSAKDVFYYVWPNVVKGGVVVFDDYACRFTVGVTKLCDELAETVNDGIFIYNLNQHGIFMKM